MPCMDSGPRETQAEINARTANRDNTLREQGRKQALKAMEPLICSACRALAQYGYDFDLNPALSEWWTAHEAQDAARVAAERQRQEDEREAEKRIAYHKRIIGELLLKPLGQLTPDEVALLKQYKYL